MAKQGAVDKLVARIDADLARAMETRGFIVAYSNETALEEKIDARIADFQRMRDYITSDGAATDVKPARPRKSGGKRKGLPTEPATT